MRLILLAIPFLTFAACGQPASEPAPPAPAESAAPVAALDETADPSAPDAAPGTPLPEPTINISPSDVPDLIAGKWALIDDPKSTLTVTADGIWTDRGGEPGVWLAMFGTEAQKVAPKQAFTPSSTYLEVKIGKETHYYELGGVGDDNLELFYLERGNRLAYTRAK